MTTVRLSRTAGRLREVVTVRIKHQRERQQKRVSSAYSETSEAFAVRFSFSVLVLGSGLVFCVVFLCCCVALVAFVLYVFRGFVAFVPRADIGATFIPRAPSLAASSQASLIL